MWILGINDNLLRASAAGLYRLTAFNIIQLTASQTEGSPYQLGDIAKIESVQ